MLLNAVGLICALLIGFAAHRASLCNVRAVSEIITAGSTLMLWSLVQAVLWMAALTGVLVLGLGVAPHAAVARTPIGWALAGGWLFGVGAAINGGCSLSTLHRLADGELSMLATLFGFAVGVSTWLAVQLTGWPAGLSPVPSPWLRWPDLAPWVLTLLLAWVLSRLRWFWQLSRRCGKASLRERLLAPAYHLSVSAAVMGLAGGLLYATQGAWSYTNFFRIEVVHRLGNAEAPTVWHGILVGGLLVGMVGSALQRGPLVWRAPDRQIAWVQHAGGGALMGAGTAMVPGGNDALLLSGLPALTSAAAGAYALMLIGITSVLLVKRVVRLKVLSRDTHD
jgi:uncharacterized membrane protein YedE/YeeE